MSVPLQRQGRAERLIAWGRLVLAALSLFAIWLDPSEPTRNARAGYGVLAAYTAAALFLAVFGRADQKGRRGVQVAIHTLDLAAATAVSYFTQGSGSPFFTYFVFAVVSGTLRWQAKGALWTGAVALGAFAGASVLATLGPGGTDFELNRFLIRVAYLAVIAVLLANLGNHESKLMWDLARLASWPRRVPDGPEDALEEALREAARTLEAPRVAAVWEDPEEPWVYGACWSAGGMNWHRDPPGRLDPPVGEGLAGRDFLCPDPAAPDAALLVADARGLSRRSGPALHPALQERLKPRSLVALVLAAETFSGWLLVLDKATPTTDDIVLGQAVARNVAASLDQARLTDRLRESAVTEERVRLARDLHDGVIQSLAAAGLKAASAEEAVRSDPDFAQTRLGEVQKILAEEQRELRAIADGLRRTGLPAPAASVEAGRRLSEVCDRVSRRWGIAVEMRCPPTGTSLPPDLAHEASCLVHEALVNAARHGEASRAVVSLTMSEDRLRLAIADDGLGFPFRGTFELGELQARRMGPVTLRERVSSRRGDLRIASTETGSRVEITLPLALGGS